MILEAAVEDGLTVAPIEKDPGSLRRNRLQTMYSGIEKENLATAADAKAPAITPKAHAGTVLVYSISGNDSNVNQNSETSSVITAPVAPDGIEYIQFSDPSPVLPSPEIRAAQMADYHAKFVSGAFDGGNGNGNGGSVNGEAGALDNSTLGERQFTTKTLPRNMAIPMPFKNELFRNPRGRYYVRDSNRGQIARAVVRLEQDGLDATVARLESMDHMWCEDNAVHCLSASRFSSELMQNEQRYGIHATNNIYLPNNKRVRGFTGVKVLFHSLNFS